MTAFTSDIFVGVVTAAVGVGLVWSGIVFPDSLATMPKVRLLTQSLGELRGRMALALLGLALIVLGGAIGVGLLGAQASRMEATSAYS